MKEFVRFLADAPGITRNCGVIGTEGVCLNARSLMLSTGIRVKEELLIDYSVSTNTERNGDE